MCDWCEKEKAKVNMKDLPDAANGDKMYGLICPKQVGEYEGKVIKKRIMGEPLTQGEEDFLKVIFRIYSPTFCGVKVEDIPKNLRRIL